MKIARRKTHTVMLLTPIVSGSGTVYNERSQNEDGTIHVGPGCTGAAARHLIAEGASPNDNMQFVRGDMVCLTGSVNAFARTSWGGATKDPQSRTWSPHPDAEIPPRLAAWYAGTRPHDGR